jgi:hypothetical protein
MLCRTECRTYHRHACVQAFEFLFTARVSSKTKDGSWVNNEFADVYLVRPFLKLFIELHHSSVKRSALQDALQETFRACYHLAHCNALLLPKGKGNLIKRVAPTWQMPS